MSDSSTIGKRIEKIIDVSNIKKVDFARIVKIDQSYVTQLIKGKNQPSDRLIDIICREFGVNEVWLRTGEGGDENMFAKLDPEDRYSISIGKISMTDDSLVQNIVNAVADATPEELRAIEKFMKRCLGLD